MDKPKLLIIDDDKAILEEFKDYLSDDFDVETAEDVRTGRKELTTNEFDVAVIDLDFPEDPDGGFKLVDYIENKGLNTTAIILTAKRIKNDRGEYFDIDPNIEKFRKLQKSVFDFIEKGGLGVSETVLNKALEASKLKELRFELSKEVFEDIKKIGEIMDIKFSDVIPEALKLLNWASEKWQQGYDISSSKSKKIISTYEQYR